MSDTTLPPGTLIRIGDAAKIMSVCRGTVYTLMDRGDIPFVRVGSDRRIPRQAVAEYIVRNTVPARPEKGAA